MNDPYSALAALPGEPDSPPLAGTDADASSLKFSAVGLSPILQRAVADQGYTTMTPIQAKAIPIVLAGRDVMGAAQTGTGKTAAFSLPLLHKMLPHENASMSPARHPVRALVITPTRELADQVADNIKGYASHSKLRVAVVFGGIDMKPQTLELKQGVEVPGRDAGAPARPHRGEELRPQPGRVRRPRRGRPDARHRLPARPAAHPSYLPKQRQTLLFSATFSPEIRRLAESYLQDPILVEVARPNATASKVEQHFYSVSTDDKRRAVLKLLKERSITQALVFVNSKLGCARLARSFERDGLRTTALHGDKSQDERLKALEAFKKGEVDVLVATDVAARGLDIVDLPAVFNFDVPYNAEDYVHRIGRTARAGASGPGDHAGLARRLAPGLRHREAARQEDRARAARARRAAAACPSASACVATTTSRAPATATSAPRASRASRARRRRRAARHASRCARTTRSSTSPTSRRQRRPSRRGSGAPRRSRAACRRTSSRRRRSPLCSAARSRKRSRPDALSQRARKENTAGTSFGSVAGPLRQRSARSLRVDSPASVRPTLTESIVAGCNCASNAPSSAAFR
jgi:superfamily II DNA/RNA helicase